MGPDDLRLQKIRRSNKWNIQLKLLVDRKLYFHETLELWYICAP